VKRKARNERFAFFCERVQLLTFGSPAWEAEHFLCCGRLDGVKFGHAKEIHGSGRSGGGGVARIDECRGYYFPGKESS
jgi:hypothetical protein